MERHVDHRAFLEFGPNKEIRMMLQSVLFGFEPNSFVYPTEDFATEVKKQTGFEYDNDEFVKDDIRFDAYEQQILESDDTVQFQGIVMRNTGIKDKDGVEMYEDDIIQEVDSMGMIHGKHHWKIIFENGCFWMYHEDFNTANQMYSWPEHCYPMFRVDHSRFSKIVGNIHQHPELLKSEG